MLRFWNQKIGSDIFALEGWLPFWTLRVQYFELNRQRAGDCIEKKSFLNFHSTSALYRSHADSAVPLPNSQENHALEKTLSSSVGSAQTTVMVFVSSGPMGKYSSTIAFSAYSGRFAFHYLSRQYDQLRSSNSFILQYGHSVYCYTIVFGAHSGRFAFNYPRRQYERLWSSSNCVL